MNRNGMNIFVEEIELILQWNWFSVKNNSWK